jgi:hypothetical protein
MPVKEYNLVALTEDLPALHKETKQPICLRRGQVANASGSQGL